jgi:hypothetical protein
MPGFDRLTHIPIQKKLIDKSLLTEIEIKWLNQYHKDVIDRVGPLMISDLGGYTCMYIYIYLIFYFILFLHIHIYIQIFIYI